MYLSRLQILNFRNHEALNLELCRGINTFTGANGSGKTGILDAVYYLANCKSYFNQPDPQLIKHGSDQFSLKGIFNPDAGSDAEDEIICHYGGRGKKNVKRNGKVYERLIDHIGLIHAVLITPYDIELVLGLSEDRRRFVDQTLCQTNRNYLSDLMRYRHLQEQRNSLLKGHGEPDAVVLEALDHHMAAPADRIYQVRQQFTAALLPIFTEAYRELSLEREVPGLRYSSDLEKGTMASLLFANRSKDRVLQRTSEGPHRDDWVFELDGQPLRKYGSQGQIKTFVIALKLAQYRYFREVSGQTPLLLLDDIFEKIDASRAQALMHTVSDERFGQILITDTHRQRVEEHLAPVAIEQKHFSL
ncbi:MAG: DNA replication/repair protein RecF [Bacteroidia bacterium]|jgi:DNA replication and repair protein RecF